ncbi:MAG: head decoration protein [Syntrophales bacterium]|nr:head decoration protein [Syntrophales bacterium]
MKNIFSGKIFGIRATFVLMTIVVLAAFARKLLGWESGGHELPLVMFGVTALSEGNYFRDVVRYEDDNAGRLSREVVTVAVGQNLSMGAVIGKITKSTPTTGTADGNNTGAGTVASVTADAKTKLGTYKIKCLTYTASPLDATFEVTDPDGLRLPDAALGAYTSEAVNFTISDASPAITVGDIWTIAVAVGSGQVKEIQVGASTAVDGSQNAYGILTDDCDASTAATAAVAIVRNAVIVSDNLVWPDGSPAVSAAEKATALAELAAKGIVEREEA